MNRLLAFFPAILPLYLFKGTFFGVPFTVPEIVLMVLFVIFVVKERLWQPAWWKKEFITWPWPALLAFVLAAVLGVFFSDDSMAALGILKGWILLPMLYAFMARVSFHKKPSLIPLALKSFLVGAVILSLMALQQVVSHEFLTPDGRASGPFVSANYLSLYVGPAFIYALFAAFRDDETWPERIALAVSALVCGAALYFSLSYAAWIAVFVTLLVGVFIAIPERFKKYRNFVLGALLGAAVVTVLIQWGSPKFTQFLDFQNQSSSSVRIQIYEITGHLFVDHPVFGLGLGAYEAHYQAVAETVLGQAPFEWVMLHPHNVYLAMWANMGLLGLGAFLYLSGRALLWLKEKDIHHKRIAALMLITILVHGVFDTPYFKNDLAFQFWLLLAILL